MDTITILKTYSQYFHLQSIWGMIQREISWAVVNLLAYIVDLFSGVVSKLYVLDEFYNNAQVKDFINSFKPLIAVLFAISFCAIGYELMFSQKKQFRDIAKNLVIAIAVIILLPEAMNKMTDLVNKGVTAVNGQPTDTANNIIKSNVVDLLLYDKANFNKTAIKQLTSPNNINKSQIRYINPTALIEPDFFNSMGIQNVDVFKKQLTIGENGSVSTEDLNQGWMTFWKEYYYRYSIDFFNVIIALLATALTLAFTSFKLARIIFELAFNQLLAMLVAPADISNGQRTKKILNSILSTFIVTFFIAVILKFYTLFIAMCSQKSGVEWLILIIAASYATIDGPNIIERIFGIDAGLQSGIKTLMGATLVGKSAVNATKTLGDFAKATSGAAGTIAGTIAGGITGTKKDDKLYKDMEKNGNGKDVKGSVDPSSEGNNEQSSNSNSKPKGLYEEMSDKNGNNSEATSNDSNTNPLNKQDSDKDLPSDDSTKQNDNTNLNQEINNSKPNLDEKALDDSVDDNNVGINDDDSYDSKPKGLYEEMNNGETNISNDRPKDKEISPNNKPKSQVKNPLNNKNTATKNGENSLKDRLDPQVRKSTLAEEMTNSNADESIGKHIKGDDGKLLATENPDPESMLNKLNGGENNTSNIREDGPLNLGDIGTDNNVQATEVPLSDGIRADTINNANNIDNDLGTNVPLNENASLEHGHENYEKVLSPEPSATSNSEKFVNNNPVNERPIEQHNGLKATIKDIAKNTVKNTVKNTNAYKHYKTSYDKSKKIIDSIHRGDKK